MEQIKLSDKEIIELSKRLNTSELISFNNKMKEILSKVDFTKIQTINNSLSSVIHKYQNINISQLTESLNQVNNGIRKALNNIDFNALENAVKEQAKQIQSFSLIIDNKEYRELIRKAVEEREIEFRQWKDRKKIEFEEIFVSLKNYINKNELNPPRNFKEFFEFWADDLPMGSYDSEISDNDFIKFHYFKEEKLNNEKKEIEKELFLMKLENELSQKPTITEKLNYWLEIKDNFKEFNPQLTSLSIPDSIYKIHFEMYENDVEFTYWLLKYSANSWFDAIKRVRNIDKKLDSLLAKDHIEAELKEINEFEEKAKANLKEKRFDIYEFHYNSQYQDEIEYLRIIDKYYEKKGQINPLSIGEAQSNSKQVMAYAKHILLKNLLENKLKELEQPAAPESPNIEEVEEKKESEVKLGLREIALFNYYTETKITSNNANEKAEVYGQKCGQKLMGHYSLITKDSLNITDHRFAVKYLKNVISLLHNFPKGKEKAEKDLKIAEYKKN
jgi:hypothetical protein